MARSGPLPAALLELAQEVGVATSYVDHAGTRREAAVDPLVAVLEGLGHRGAGRDPAAALRELRGQRRDRLTEPVSVVVAGARASLSVRAPSASRIEVHLSDERGRSRSFDGRGRAVRGHQGLRRVPLPDDLDIGYYTAHVVTAQGSGTSHVLVRPPSAMGRFGASWRATGLAAPLFSLHREEEWGCGDLADLSTLADLGHNHGVTVVATLPLLAGPLPPSFEPSPYLPLSRRFWHERWVDLDDVVRRWGSPAVRTAATAAHRRARDAAAAAHPLVDGAASLLEKRAVLGSVLDEQSERGALGDLEAYLSRRPEVVAFARFLAASERLGARWQDWPAAARGGVLRADDVASERERFHCFVQWVLDGQLDALATRLEARGQVLSLDLPLGVHPWGYDVWQHRDQFVEGLTIGAPPDRFFPGGQDWSMPFPRLAANRSDGHRLFRESLRHHLGIARMLRIDHILGLQRLFCIPDGATPRDGVYVQCELEELLAVVAIEAHRARAEVVGEDLGTVDARVRRAMSRDALRRMSVVELSVRTRGRTVVAPPPASSVASFSTHDLATFAGWWTARDIDERLATGQIDEDGAHAMRERRAAERRRLSAGSPPSHGDAPTPTGLLDAVMTSLGHSDAGVVVAQLDDLVGELDAVNLPGTSFERPNWQHRVGPTVESVEKDPAIAHALDALDVARATTGGATRRRGDVLTVPGVTRLDDDDLTRFEAGRHAWLHERLGAHPMEVDSTAGTYFATWAPRAAWVEVVGDFNGWDGRRHPLSRREGTGIFEGFLPGVGPGDRYRLRLAQREGRPFEKADPFAARTELPRSWSSVVHQPGHTFSDADFLAGRAARQSTSAAISIYEVHLGSWRRLVEDDRRPLSYRELAPRLVEHVTRLGFTHVELLPVMDHPLYASWGYQVTSYFAPSARYGTPDDFSALVDELHEAGIGVLLDWVPAHFPTDDHALAQFDGAPLFEHADPRKGTHPEWTTLIFDYGRGEVRSFLLSSASCWIDRYHADGLRFDAVASMLYLDYARGAGEWEPNVHGGREHLEAVEFLQSCNTVLHQEHPGAITMAEESTAWPKVTAPVEEGGLGFDYKWDLGWMHDTLNYLKERPEHRRFHHDRITFRSLYAANEQFVLPLSHDEVVHGKGSLLDRMPGDERAKLANVRLLLGLQLAQPGKKLLFMGDEFAQVREWAHDHSLDWHLLADPGHAGVVRLVAALNDLYRTSPALHRDDLGDRGFAWLVGDDRDQSVFVVERHDDGDDVVVIACNAGDTERADHDVPLPRGGEWRLVVSSDDEAYGGDGLEVPELVHARAAPMHGRPWRGAIVLPAFGFVVYRPEERSIGAPVVTR